MIFCHRQTRGIWLLTHTWYSAIVTHMKFCFRQLMIFCFFATHDFLLSSNTWYSTDVTYVIFYQHLPELTVPYLWALRQELFSSAVQAQVYLFVTGTSQLYLKWGFQEYVIKWTHFPRYWPFVGEFTGHRWLPSQRPLTRSFDVFFYLHPKKWLIKKGDPSDLKHHRAHYDATVMWCGGVDNLSEAISLYIDITEKRHPVRALLCFVVNRYQHILPMFHCYFTVVWQTVTASETLNQPWRIHCRTRIRKIVYLDIHWMYCDADIYIYIYYIFFGIINIFLYL